MRLWLETMAATNPAAVFSSGPPGKAPRRGSSGKGYGYSRLYPRGVGIDFRKLAGPTLLNYIDHHGACTCY